MSCSQCSVDVDERTVGDVVGDGNSTVTGGPDGVTKGFGKKLGISFGLEECDGLDVGDLGETLVITTGVDVHMVGASDGLDVGNLLGEFVVVGSEVGNGVIE
jgi:hypothetical protein